MEFKRHLEKKFKKQLKGLYVMDVANNNIPLYVFPTPGRGPSTCLSLTCVCAVLPIISLAKRSYHLPLWNQEVK